MKAKSLSRVLLFVTPWTVAYQAPPSMGFSRQECWSGLPFPSPGDLPNLGIEPGSSALQADALTSEPPGKLQNEWNLLLKTTDNQKRIDLYLVPFSSVAQLCLILCNSMASLSITNSQSLLKLISIKSMMPSNHLILCHALLLPPSIFPSIRVFSNESVLCIR